MLWLKSYAGRLKWSKHVFEKLGFQTFALHVHEDDNL